MCTYCIRNGGCVGSDIGWSVSTPIQQANSWLYTGRTQKAEDEVYEMIVSLDTFKANESDSISERMLKGTALSITPVLTHLFNMSIVSGIFPDKWKLSSVVPIPKGGDHSNPSNYRPISL